jgi:UPF0755 protein
MIKKQIKILLIIVFTFIILLVAGGLFFFLEISSFAKKPFNSADHNRVFTIKSGQSLNFIAQNLEQQAIIANQTYFKLFTRFKKSEKKLQAGEYLLSASKTPEQILETLIKGRVKLYKLTVPEGLNIKEVASLVEKSSSCNAVDFINLCYNTSFISSLGVKTNTLEGYLFPDTYFFPKNTSCKNVATTMVEHFKSTITNQWQKRAKKLGLSIHEIVTLASIIEKETGDASERPLISSVFHNRLKKNMRLESDPTVIYGIKNFDGNIKRKHLKMVTPYNTYQMRGLPVGPIANPGALSLKAALYPVQSKYIFFVSKKDTTHKFSRTLKEHNQAVRKYQLRRK